MKKKVRSILQVFLAFTLLYSIVMPSSLKTIKAEDLVNIAAKGDFLVKSTEAGRLLESIADGDVSTLWCARNGEWPTTVRWTAPEDNLKKIEKVVIKFEAGHPTWAVDIALNMYKNGDEVAIPLKSVQGNSFANEFVYEFKDGENPSDILLTIDNPKNGSNVGTYSPAIAEFEVYVGDTEVSKSFDNLAPEALITCASSDPETAATNLVDDNYNSLYIFHKGTIASIPGGEAWVQLDLKDDYDVNSFEIAFEKKVPDSMNFVFTYSIYGMSKEDTDWTTLVSSAKATRAEGDNIKKHKIAVDDNTKKLSKVKVVLESLESTGSPWPAIAEFKINGIAKEIVDEDNLAFRKQVHTNTNQKASAKLTDGNTLNSWSGAYYPGYADIDLEKNYNIDEVQVFLPTTGYTQYDIYTSMDGRDYEKLATKTNTESTPSSGDVFAGENKEARFLRVYINYQSLGVSAIMNEVRVLGKASDTPLQEVPAIDIPNFEESEYQVEITPSMAIEEVQGIITRQIGEAYVDWFTFSLAENPKQNGYDYYQIENGENGKIHITGNDGVSLATGLNYYLKYYLNVNISQVGNQVHMPEATVEIGNKAVFKETKLPVRYAYNYCTFSYSMPFWGEKEWRNELDWLALNGVNLVLDPTAQEEVWRRFLDELGYTHQEAKDFISGPAYYAWAYMANLSGFGGPVHDNWFSERTKLARDNHLIMRKLGMQPIMQGYSGMVPVDIESKDDRTKGNTIQQGTWNAFQRPSMLKTTSGVYKEYASKFYKIQKEVFGDITDYYATDPFHEGGITGGMNMTDISRIVLEEMMNADQEAVWVIQSWQSNPTTNMLNGIGDNKKHALILDLWAERYPRWEGKGLGWSGQKEFSNTPWVYCMLNNFGGRLGMRGYLDTLVKEIPRAMKEASYLQGIGITPEASINNPIIYDLFFETIWSDDGNRVETIDLDAWLKNYATRRYGAKSDAAYQAMQILNETVYNPAYNTIGEGATESVINARPNLNISQVSCCGKTTVQYDKAELEKAGQLLLQDYDKLKNSDGYQYDLANVLEQILSNTAQEYQKAMTKAYQGKDLERFTAMSNKFLAIVDMVEKVTGTQPSFMVGTWVNQAKALAANSDEFTKELYEFNARALITTWGSIYQANTGGLKDYSNRQWSGLTQDYYKVRWQTWITERVKDLRGETGKTITDNDWFQMEWDWANGNNEYTSTPNGLDLQVLGTEILSDFSVNGVPKDPSEDDRKDCPIDDMSTTTGSQQYDSGSEGPASNLLDQNKATIWHSAYVNSDRSKLWVDVDLGKATLIDGLRYQPRQDGGTNGIITGYKIEVKDSSGQYKEVASGTWANNGDWKMAIFEPIEATHVKLYATASASNTPGNVFASGAELRITRPMRPDVDKEALQKLYDKVKDTINNGYTAISWTIFQDTLTQTKDILLNDKATQEMINAAATALTDAYNNLAEDTTLLKSILKSAIDKAIAAEASEEFKTLAPSVKAMITLTRSTAQELYAKPNATNAQCLEAWMNLADALQYLDFKADKELLSRLIADCELINLDEYKSGVEAFQVALAKAKSVNADANVLQASIDEAYKSLELARAGLIKNDTVDKTALIEMIAKIKNNIGDGSKYQQNAAYDVFKKALAAAEALVADKDATVAELVTVMHALADAYADIRLIPSEAQLQELRSFVQVISRLNRGVFTKQQLAFIDKTTATAQAMMENFDDKKFVTLQQDMAEIVNLINRMEDKEPLKPLHPANPGINGDGSKTKPATGDDTNALALISLLLLSGCGIAFMQRKRHKKAEIS